MNDASRNRLAFVRSFSRLLSTGVFLFLFSFLSLAQDARELTAVKPNTSDKRIALVIGNGAYRHASPLANPANDAVAMAKALRDVGFEVIGGESAGINLTQEQMDSLITEFGERLRSTKGVGLFYYAGHGLASGGQNYLVPVDADIPDETKVRYKAIPVGMILDEMAAAGNGFNLIILDACRNNPFARAWRGLRDIGDAKGLVNSNPPRGTLVLYATQPGGVSIDGVGGGKNGLFTEALLRQIKKPNLELDPLVKLVARDVEENSKQKQSPWKEGLYSGDFYFVPVAAAAINPAITETQLNSTTVVPRPTPLPTPTTVSVTQNLDGEGATWQYVTGRDTQSVYELYLAEYPSGKHAVEALNKIDKFKQDELARLKDIERAKWRDAQSLNSKDAYNAYIAAYPNGEFAANARSGISAIETKDEQATWDEVLILNRKIGFQSYLSAYPNGKYATAAKQKIGEFEANEALKQKELEKAAEKAKWDEAERSKTVGGYKDYLTAYPKGEFASLCRLRLRDLGVVVDAPVVTLLAPKNNTTNSILRGTVRKNLIGMELVYITPGEFWRGDSLPHVTISQGFWMGKYEVTQGQWERVMGTNFGQQREKAGDSFGIMYRKNQEGADCAMVDVNWEEAKEFVRRMNQKDDGFEYSLPSEAQWEHAAWGGTTNDYRKSFKDIPGSVRETHLVGTEPPNNFGLYDMFGNVWEWVQDWSGDHPTEAVTDPNGPSSGTERVLHGGEVNYLDYHSGPTNVISASPTERRDFFGFRVAARLK